MPRTVSLSELTTDESTGSAFSGDETGASCSAILPGLDPQRNDVGGSSDGPSVAAHGRTMAFRVDDGNGEARLQVRVQKGGR